MPSRHAATAVASLALAAAALTATADVVVLRGGRRVVGVVEESDDVVRVSIDGGKLAFARKDVVRIERVLGSGKPVRDRIAELREGDVAAALAIAADASKAGFADEARRALDFASRWAPDDPLVRAALRRWQSLVRVLPDDEAAEAGLTAAFGSGANLRRTPHFVIAYDTTDDAVRGRAELLEAAYRKVHALAESLGLEPAPIEAKLEILVFADHAGWVASLAGITVATENVTGAFVPTTRRVHLFDTNSAPEVVAAGRDVARAKAELDAHEARLEPRRDAILELRNRLAKAIDAKQKDAARGIESQIEDAEARLVELEIAIAEFRGQVDAAGRAVAEAIGRENIASTTHEACHQIAFATGICREGQPAWLLEGLAMLFEVTNRTSFVPEAVNEPRLAELRAAWSKGRTTRLADVVSDSVFTAPDANLSAAYAESWSAAYFLARKHPDGFARLVREGRSAPIDAESTAARLEDFRRVFGADLDALDAAWKDDVRLLR